ncbi:PilN family type IVB pilus formation outer membrane protein [Burkholderia multivorans]|uniref:PilN family type IVB pilus formation outer membrane protein n=1 Tax=Burkholderia multivorans TaxID=87883 RepID=UPI001FC8500D|nr:PilN family type IVB pilus formation outer membrane protein [Burkholderia multivorans]
MKKTLIVIAAFTVQMLSGCDTFQHASHIEASAENDKATIAGHLNSVSQLQTHANDTVQYLSKQWVSLTPILEAVAAKGPRLDCGTMNIVTNEPVSVYEFGQVITKKCGIPVHVTDDAIAAIYNPDLTAGRTLPSAGQGLTAGANVVPPLGPNASSTVKIADDHKIDINCRGCDLNEIMDMVVSRLGVSWRPDDDRHSIRIYNIDTQTFPVHLIASGTDGSDTDMRSEFQSGTTQVNGVSSSQAGGSGASSGSGSGSSSTMQTTVVALKTSLWKEIQSNLETIAGKGNVSVAPSMGSVTVTASRARLDAAKRYIDSKNKLFDKFVTFNVQLISVTFTNTDSTGVSWNALYKTLTGKYGISVANSFAAPTNAINGAFSILSTSGSPWAGTQAIVSALNEQGSARLLRSTQLPTMNLNAVATQTGEQQSYLASTSTTQTAQVGSSTALQPGTINTGFNISMFPYIREDNKIQLRMNINLSSLKGQPRVVESNGSKAELPDISLPLNTSNTIRVRPGDTVMLAGQDYDDENSTRDGAGTAKFFGFGGGVNVTRSRTMLVVLITPVLADD